MSYTHAIVTFVCSFALRERIATELYLRPPFGQLMMDGDNCAQTKVSGRVGYHHMVDGPHLSNTDIADDECNLLSPSDDDENNECDNHRSNELKTDQHMAPRVFRKLRSLVRAAVLRTHNVADSNSHSALYRQLHKDTMTLGEGFKLGHSNEKNYAIYTKDLSATPFADKPEDRDSRFRVRWPRLIYLILIVALVLWLMASISGWLIGLVNDSSGTTSHSTVKLNQSTEFIGGPEISFNKSTVIVHESNKQAERWLVANSRCHIPVLEPWHESIKEYVQVKPAMNCKKIFAKHSNNESLSGSLTFVRDNRLFFTREAIEKGTSNLRCCYRSIKRVKGNDGDLSYSDECEKIEVSNPIHLTSIGLQIQYELIEIECKELNYANVHAFTLRNTEEEVALKKLASEKLIPDRHYNVLMVGIDTISRLNAIRQLQNTLQVLRRSYNTTEFYGYNKVGENTFPNLIPLLTGLTPEQLVKVNCWAATNYTQNSDKGDAYLDNCKYLWNYYHQSGYVTYFSEDWPKASTFNYLKPGFKEKPTVFYGRPFTLAREKYLYPHVNMGCSSCQLDEPVVRIDLDNLKNFVQAQRHYNMPYFAFHWINCPQHDDLNGASQVDKILADFLGELHNITYNERTFVIVFSDHGYRWGSFVSTQIGHHESSLPLLTIAPPASFIEEHPDEYQAFIGNTKELITPFNMFHTMIHIKELGEKVYLQRRVSSLLGNPPIGPNDLAIMGTDKQPIADTVVRNGTNQTTSVKEGNKSVHLSKLLDGLTYPHNISTFDLFDKRVRQDRSCIEAGIPDNYCVCHNFEEVSINDYDVIAAAYYLVYIHIAGKIAHDRDICSTLNLRSIRKAEVFDFTDMKTQRSSRNKRDTGNATDKFSTNSMQVATTTQPPEQVLELSKLNKYHSLPNREYNIFLETSPGGGLFQEVVRFYGDDMADCKEAVRDIKSEIEDPNIDYDDKIKAVIRMDKRCDFSVHSDSISRLNLYGDQSKCVKNNIELRKICYCK